MMKKLYYTAILLLAAMGSHAQFAIAPPAAISFDQPQVIPPSPTVAAMMRFEEVPVSNYTGVPDVTVPLYSVGSHSKDVTVSLSLKYHPSSVRTDEVAGYTGLGWSLFGAGGTISRTVRGFPDELLDVGSASNPTRMGIHNYDAPGSYPNRYHTVLGMISNGVPTGNHTLEKYLYEGGEKGKYDTEHDLYQYDFQGYSGRFILKRDQNGYTVVKMDTNPVKIIYNEGPKDFTIYDDKGYRYVFDIKEQTTSYTNTLNNIYGGGVAEELGQAMTYTSAYQLSATYSPNQVLLVQYAYDSFTEVQKNTSTVYSAISDSGRSIVNYFMGVSPECSDLLTGKIEPTKSLRITNTSVVTKKIKTITVTDKATITFINSTGRNDTNIVNSADVPKLDSFTVTNRNGSGVRRFLFQYDPYDKLILEKVLESNVTSPQLTDYQTTSFSYNGEPAVAGKDYWGYPSSNLGCAATGSGRLEPSKTRCTQGVLNKITYPTGGCTVFGYESNTYSYIGSQALSDFRDNPDNSMYPFSGTVELASANCVPQNGIACPGSSFNLGVSSVERRFVFSALLSSGGGLQVFGTRPGYDSVSQAIATPVMDPQCEVRMTLLAGYSYKIVFEWFDSNSQGSATVNYKEIVSVNPPREWLYGGGIRIKTIGNFTNSSVPKNYYETGYQGISYSSILAKEKKYDYRFLTNDNRSSGALVFGKPDFKYNLSRAHGQYNCSVSGTSSMSINESIFHYAVVSDFNNLSAISTHGSDVGYQNVRVTENGNGKTEYVYNSPIDFPEDEVAYSGSFPFLPSVNLDYKRGNPKSDITYNQAGKQLVKNVYAYDYEDHLEVSGLRLFNNGSCAYSKHYVNYDGYQSMIETCGTWTQDNCIHNCGAVTNFASYYVIREAFGEAKLSSKTTTEYFYNASNIQSGSFETQQSFTYNLLNRKIASQSSNSSLGETLRTDYTYRLGADASTINRISDIERIDSFRNGTPLSSSRVAYSNTFAGNSSYLPQVISASKGGAALQDRLRYNRYDAFGNVLEVQQENGTRTSYVWGYDDTQPVAKIENMAYADISSSLITTVKNQSHYTPPSLFSGLDKEPNLQTALTALRDSLPANAMATTYTYWMLVGMRTATDPKGDRNSYSYDGFARLINIKDRFGNYVSENSYNYRPQTTN